MNRYLNKKTAFSSGSNNKIADDEPPKKKNGLAELFSTLLDEKEERRKPQEKNILDLEAFKVKFTNLFIVKEDTTEGDKLLEKGKIFKGNVFLILIEFRNN